MTEKNRTRWLIRGLFLFPLLFIITACDGIDEQESIDKARGYLEVRNVNPAILELKNVLIKNKSNAEARYMLGQTYIIIGDTDAAEKELRRALDAGWDESAVMLALTEVAYRQGNFQKVLADFPVKDSYPAATRADLMGFRAASEAGLGQWDKAAQTIKTGELINQDSLWLLFSKIRLNIYQDDLIAAEQVLEQALKAHPDSQDLWLLSARLAEESGDDKSIITALQKVIDLDPPRNISFMGRVAHLSQTEIWIGQEDYTKAQTAIDPILKTYDNDPTANYLAGLIGFNQGKYTATEEHLLKVLRVFPEHRPSLSLFGILDFTRGDYDQAAYYLEKAASIQPQDTGTQTMLGRTYFMLGEYDKAEESLLYVSSKVDANAELQAIIGLARLKGGDEQAGIQELEKAAALAPADTAIRNELARVYISTGSARLAAKELESILEESEQQYQTEALLVLAYFHDREFDKAINVASQLAKQVPDSPVPHNLAGAVHEANEDFLSARESYQNALRIDPENSLSQLGLARLDLLDGNTQAARNHYQEILKKDQDNPQALLGLGKTIGSEGDVKEAIQLAEQARSKNPRSLESKLFLAEFYLQKNNYAKALMLSEEAIEISPADPRALALLGQAQISSNKGKEALTTLNTLVKNEPDWADAHYYLSQAQAYNNDFLSAKKSIINALQLDPSYTKAKVAHGYLELHTGNTKGALKIAQELQNIKESELDGYLLEGSAQLASKELAKSVHAYQMAFDHSPTSTIALKLYHARKVSGHTEDAMKGLEKWLEANPQDGIVRAFLANAYQANGNIDRAIIEYKKVIKQWPATSPLALNNIAWLYYEGKNDKKQAIEYARRAYQIAPENIAIVDSYGWLLVENGSIEQGLTLLHKAAKASKTSTIHYHLAVALVSSGERDVAVEELNTILENDQAFPERDKAKALLQKLN